MSVPWLPGEPDNVDDGEDCVAYGDDGVADVNCSAVLPFACYKRSSPNMTVKSCGTTDTEYEYSSKTLSCYKFHKIKRTWAEAFKICSAEGGYLAIINSAEEASVLTEINLSHRHQASIWSGFYDWKKDGAWRTVHGQTLEEAGYAHWETGQPENKEKYCGSMYPVNDHLYNYVCTRELSFVCELDPNSF